MPSDDRRASRIRDSLGPVIVHEGVRPRKVPPKMWDPSKPPGGKRLEPPPTPDKQS